MSNEEKEFYAHWDSVSAAYGFGNEHHTAHMAAKAAWSAQASTIVALKEQLASVYEQAALACENESVEHTGTDGDIGYNMAIRHAAAAIRALASQPAAPVQQSAYFPAGAIHNAEAFCARLENIYDFQCEAGPLGNCYEWTELRRCINAMAGYLAAPPVQQPGDVRDLRAEIINLPCDVEKCPTKDWPLAYKYGHRDARHAAAELVASVEHEALATTRPSAAPQGKPVLMAYVATDLDGHADVGFTIEEAKRRAGHGCDTIIALHDISAEFVELEGKHITDSPAILAASSGALAVPEGGAA